MIKKVVIIVGIVIILIVAGYIGYKTYILNKYNVANLGNTYQEIIESFNNKETVTINNQQLSEEEYTNFQNIKFKNIVEGYTKEEIDSTYPIMQYKNEIEKKLISISTMENFVSLFTKDGITILGTMDSDEELPKNIESAEKRKAYLEKNNITNDLELLDFLGRDYAKKVSLFDNINDIKGRYDLHYLTTIAMPKIKSITEITGDYTGYILNVNDTVQEVTLLINDKKYTITFSNFTEDEIYDFISSIIIDDSCQFTKTYRVEKIIESNDEGYLHVTLTEFQKAGAETVTIPREINNNIEEGKYYEFTFSSNQEDLSEDMNNIFENTEVVSIVETEKTGLDQIQEKVCKVL